MKMKIKLTDILHLGACLVCALVVSAVLAHTTTEALPCIVGGFLSGVALGVGKEYGDSRASGNSWSWSDMLYNVIGAAIGSMNGFAVYLIHV